MKIILLLKQQHQTERKQLLSARCAHSRTPFAFHMHDYRSVVSQSNAFLIWSRKLSGMKRDTPNI